jgi:hypothetical protein
MVTAHALPFPAQGRHGTKAGSQNCQSQRTARHRVLARWTSPRRGRGQGALGCGRPGPTRAHAFDCKETTLHTGDRGTAAARHMARRRAAGWPSVPPSQTKREGTFASTADAAYLGWQRRGAASRATRVVARSWENGNPPALGGLKARAHARPREDNGARREETTVLTAGRRCSRCRPEVDGGAV